MSARRRRVLLYAPPLFVAASVAIIYFGVEHIRNRNAVFDAEVKSRKGAVYRNPQTPEWMDSKYLKPAAKWLEPLLPTRVTVIEKHADLARVRGLRTLKGLDKLYLDRSKLNDSDLTILSEFGDLTELSLSGLQFTDACLDSLPNLPRLQILRFEGTSLTNRSLPKLSAYADRLGLDGIHLDLQRTRIQLARDIHVAFPSRTQDMNKFDIIVKFKLDEGVATRWSGHMMFETRKFNPESDCYTITNQWSAQLIGTPKGEYSYTQKFHASPPGEHEWSVWLTFVPVGRAMVAFTLAEGRVQVDPAPPAAPVAGK